MFAFSFVFHQNGRSAAASRADTRYLTPGTDETNGNADYLRQGIFRRYRANF
jgi:hypothetical protein